jgi:uncharacterized repeat protein (TIGR02543 family)
LSYTAGGGTGTPPTSTTATQYYNSGGAATNVSTPSFTLASNTFSRTGYTFSKWDVGNAGSAYTGWKPGASDTTVTKSTAAVWTSIPYKVVFKSGNTVLKYTSGSNTLEEQNFAYDTAQNLPAISTFTNIPVSSTNGWTFVGWTTNASSTNTATYTDGQSVKNLTATANATVTLYAIWKRSVEFTYYNSASATTATTTTASSNPASPVQYYRNTSTTAAGVSSVATPALVKQTTYNWDPQGWALNSTTKVTSLDSTASTTSGNVSPAYDGKAHYYAVYKRTSKLTYNGNTNTGGSTANTTSTQYYNAGSTAANESTITTAANGFTKTGYRFTKWAKGSATGTQVAASTSMTFPNTGWSSSDTYTMYANWTPNTYTVTFKSGNTTLGTQNFTYDTAQGLTNISSLTNIPVNSSLGWTFVGWATEANVNKTTADYTNTQSVKNLTATHNGNVNLYAIWKRTVTLKYYNSASATTVTTNTDQIQYYRNTTTSESGATNITLPALATQSTYKWAPQGWVLTTTGLNTGASGCTTATSSTTILPDYGVAANYYALYKRTAKLTYNGNNNTGGSTADTTGTQYFNAGSSNGVNSSGEALSLTTATNGFSRTGYEFNKWAKGSATGEKIAQNTSMTFPNKAWTSSDAYTLYADWTANPYTVVFKSGDTTLTYKVNSTTYSSQSFTYDVSQNLPAISTFTNIPVNSTNGWTFVGWTTNAEGATTAAYTDGQSVKNLTATKNGTVTLYAIWKRNVSFTYYDGASATSTTTKNDQLQYYRNTSTTAAGVTSVNTYVLATQSTYDWAPQGWVLNSTTGTTTASTATTTAGAVSPAYNGKASYYALYKRTAVLTYNGNTNTGGSTSNTTGNQYFNAGSSAANALSLTTATNGFTKTGYTFDKWAQGSVSGTKIAQNTSMTFPNTAWNITRTYNMYAIWKANPYTVTFKSGNTTLGTQSFTYDQAQNLKDISSLENIPVSADYGWIFKGWAKNSNTTTPTYTNKQSVNNLTATNNGNVTLYAIWERTVNFEYYDGASATTTTKASRIQYYYNTSDTEASTSAVSTFALATQSTYNWEPQGWVLNDSTSTDLASTATTTVGNVNPGKTSRVSSSEITPHYYANYKRTAVLAYEGNGNTGGSTDSTTGAQKFNAGRSAAFTLILTTADNGFTKTGYTFDKWAAGSASGTKYAEKANFTFPNTGWSTSRIYSMYATWTANPYKVVFKSGNTKLGEEAFVYDTEKALTSISSLENIPVSSTNEWTFVGWTDNPNSTTTASYTDGQKVKNLTTTYNGTVTLYAIWKRNVTFKYYDGASATSVTTKNDQVQYYRNTSATAAGVSSVNTYALATQSTYDWAPQGWVLNSASDTTTAVTSTTATSISPAYNAKAYYYALYTRSAILVYDGNGKTGGSTSSTTGTQYYNTGASSAFTLILPLAENGYTKTGYTFDKWAAGSVSGTKYAEKANFTFPNSGWSTSRSYTMYATWNANPYKVVFKSGNTKLGEESFIYDIEKNLTGISNLENIPVAAANGWTFVGWTDNPSSTTTAKYTDTQKVKNLTTEYNGTVTLYAIWKRNVSFKYYDSASATQTTTKSDQIQYYRNTSATAAGVSSVNTYALATQSTYKWAPQGWVLNSTTSTSTASSATTTAGSVSPAHDGKASYYALYKRTATLSYQGNTNTGGSTANTTGNQYYNAGSTEANVLTLKTAVNGFTKLGYTFDKWAVGAVSGTQIAANTNYNFPNVGWASSDVCKLYAIWIANPYNIEYVLNDGSFGTSHPTSAVYDTPFKVDNPVRIGYYFDGWTITNMSTDCTHYWDDFQANTDRGKNASAADVLNTKFNNLRSTSGTVKFEAKWTEMSGILTYKKNGHGTVPDPITLWFTLRHTAIPMDDVEGYHFEEWNTKANGTGYGYEANSVYKDACCLDSEDGTDVIPNGATLYAIWKELTGTLKYNANGIGTAPEDQTMYYSQEATVKTIKNVEGYIFRGWATSKARADEEIVDFEPNAVYKRANKLTNVNDQTVITSGATLYAVWIKDDGMLHYNVQGHGTAPDSENLRLAKETKVASNKMSVIGWTFKEWNTKADGTGHAYQPGDLFKAEDSMNNTYGDRVIPHGATLYAIWIEKTAKLTYDNNYTGGATSTVTMKYTTETRVKTSTPPARTGFEFLGWNTGKLGAGKDYQANDVFKEANVEPIESTLYAKWKEKTATLKYKNPTGYENVGTLPEDETMYYSQVARVNGTMSARGYNFKGWATTSAKALAGTVDYTTGQKIKDANVNPTNTTLWAVWEIEQHHMTIDANGGTVNGNATRTVTLTVNGTNWTDINTTGTAWPVNGTKKCTGLYTLPVNGTQVYNDKGHAVNDGTFFDNGVFIYDEDFTLYAQWEKEKIRCVTYNKNTTDTVTYMPDDEYKYLGTDIKLSGKVPKRDGYTFKYWSTDPEGNAGDTYYVQNGSGSVFPIKSDAKYNNYSPDPVTLYAIWKKNKDVEDEADTAKSKLNVQYNIYESDVKNGLLDAEIEYNYRNLFMQDKTVKARRSIFVDDDTSITPDVVLYNSPTWSPGDEVPGVSGSQSSGDPTNPSSGGSSGSGDDDNDDEVKYTEVSTENELRNAINNFDYSVNITNYIALKNDITLNSTIIIPNDANVEIEMSGGDGGYTISTASGKTDISAFGVYGTLAIKNGTISAVNKCISVYDTGDFTAENMTMKDAVYAVYFEEGYDTATAEITKSKIDTTTLCGTENEYSYLLVAENTDITSTLYADFTGINTKGLNIEEVRSVNDPSSYVDKLAYSVESITDPVYNYKVTNNNDKSTYSINIDMNDSLMGGIRIDGVEFEEADDEGLVQQITGDYFEGTKLTLVAVPDEHSRFVKWINKDNEHVISNDETFELTVTENINIQAVFEHIPHTVTLTVNDENYGTVSVAGTYGVSVAGTYGESEDVTIEAIPKDGCEFLGWADITDGDDPDEDYIFDSSDTKYTFEMPEYDVTYKAVFESTGEYKLKINVPDVLSSDNENSEGEEINDYTIQVVTGDSTQNLTNGGELSFNIGDQFTLKAIIANKEDYSFTGWADTSSIDSGNVTYVSTSKDANGDGLANITMGSENMDLTLVLDVTDKKANKALEAFKKTEKERIDSELESYKDEYLDQTQPIGSVWTTTDSSYEKGNKTDTEGKPVDSGLIAVQDQFGGKWKRVENAFLYAQGSNTDKYPLGATGGKFKYDLSLAMNAGSGKFGYVPRSVVDYQEEYNNSSLSNDIAYGKFNETTDVPDSESVIVVDEEQTGRSTSIIPPFLSVFVFERIDEFENIPDGYFDGTSTAKKYTISKPGDNLIAQCANEGYHYEVAKLESDSTDTTDALMYSKGYRYKIVEVENEDSEGSDDEDDPGDELDDQDDENDGTDITDDDDDDDDGDNGYDEDEDNEDLDGNDND